MLNIRKYRKKSGLTQARTAEKFGVRANAVSQWETGVRSPSVRHLRQMAALFGCSTDDLLKRDEDKNVRNANP